MATQQLMLPGEIVKKHNELVRSKISIDSVAGSRILASLIACIKHDDMQFKETYSFSIKELLTNDSGKSYQEIKVICKDLAKATAELEYHNAPMSDGTYEDIFIITPFFIYISYRKGVIQARFNGEMQGCLLDLKKHFTQYNLLEYLLLPSIYSQRIFEILKSWSNRPEVNISLAELHEMLNTPESFKADFRNFRLRVLEKAHKDIHEKTSLSFEWEPLKKGRAVTAVRFIFAPGKKVLAQKEQKKLKQQNQSTQHNKLFMAALNCLQSKGGLCENASGRKTVCEICRRAITLN